MVIQWMPVSLPISPSCPPSCGFLSKRIIVRIATASTNAVMVCPRRATVSPVQPPPYRPKLLHEPVRRSWCIRARHIFCHVRRCSSSPALLPIVGSSYDPTQRRQAPFHRISCTTMPWSDRRHERDVCIKVW
ncbi:hypothetical protein M408DRAFT_327794 [Serendipita vermifera MAFF 305830]|uniref:Uncharacterized protein n=1 Tax=Serendipita vermifera MAFF 305830 TaxID=933852 RepID=A0A0C3BFA9_SERVB|nr:hypothetical protein M408DRAFT_327794 [Serendipita vermifera MAFF 305830]